MDDVLSVVCPRCDAQVGERCVTAGGAFTGQPHASRVNLAWRQRPWYESREQMLYGIVVTRRLHVDDWLAVDAIGAIQRATEGLRDARIILHDSDYHGEVRLAVQGMGD